jgi:hypothetical protein
MPGQIGTSIRANTRKIHSGDREADGIDAAGLAQARERFALLDRDISQLSDDQLRNLVVELERRFRDEALTSASQAATIILDGVKADRWRILVGADAHKIDEMVRQSPERAYDIAFFDEFARAAGWSERLRALIDRVIEQMLATGHVRWASSGAPLVRNFPRDFRALRSPRTGRPIAIGLSKGSAIIEGTVAWYVDAQTGAVGRARLIASEPRDPAATARAEEVRGRSNQPPAKCDFSAAPAVIVEGRPVPHLTLFKATPPAGTMGAAIDVAQLRFLYGEASVDLEDERQFARNPGAGVSSLVLPAISGCSR